LIGHGPIHTVPPWRSAISLLFLSLAEKFFDAQGEDINFESLRVVLPAACGEFAAKNFMI